MWGSRVITDPLLNFFIHTFEQKDLLDIEPIKLNPTWRNRRTREDRVAKHLDRFLVAKDLLGSLELIRQYVSIKGDSEHSPIILEMRRREQRLLGPFKFNAKWLKDQAYLDLIHKLWIPFKPNSHYYACVHFVENLKWIKKDTITSAHAKKVRDDQDMTNIKNGHKPCKMDVDSIRLKPKRS